MEQTPNLKLNKYNVITDAKQPFDIEKALNTNWDQIDNQVLNKTQITNCILAAPNGVVTYSGTTLTAKQGLKVLIPNGRNADGTLNNIENTLNEDLSFTHTSGGSWDSYIVIVQKSNEYILERLTTSSYYKVKKLADRPPETPNVTYIVYVEEENKTYLSYQGAEYVEYPIVIIGKYSHTANSITSIQAYLPIEFLKRTDSQEIINWCIPDYTKAINILSLTTYTCPSNGWLLLQCRNQKGNDEGYIRYKSNQSTVPYYISIYTSGILTQTAAFPVIKDEILTKDINQGVVSAIFIPMKGANNA